MGDELATLADKIKKTEEKVEKLEEHIANNNFAGTPYDDRAEAKAALKDLEADLRAQEADLRRLLILDKEEKARLQQQSGAGTSMLMCLKKTDLLLPKIVFVCIAWIRSSVCLQAAGAAYPIDDTECIYWFFVSLSQMLQCPKGTWRRYRPLSLKSLTK
jgi:multidrug resistance efflux pump